MGALPGRPGWQARPSLIAYGVIPALQAPDGFGRVCAASGGVFVIMSLLRGLGNRPSLAGNHDWLAD